MKRLMQIVFVGLSLAMAVSCGPKPGQNIESVISEGKQLASEGQVDKALSHLTRYYKSKAYESDRPQLLATLIQIEWTAGRVDAVKTRFLAAATSEPGPSQQYLGAVLRGREWAMAEALLSPIEAGIAKLPAWTSAAATARIELTLGRDGYKAALSHVSKVRESIPDEAAARGVKVVGEAAMAAGDLAVADAFYESALNSAPDRVKTREAGADGWVRVASRRGSVAMVVSRLERLDKDAFPTTLIMNLVSESYPLLLGRGNNDTFKALFDLCERLDKRGVPQGERTILGGIMLDISYYLSDFELSLKLIESGMVEIQGDQKLQMIAKVHAHLAMKQGKPREAVGYLREFMGYIAKQDRSEIDPVNNCQVTRDMILGLNAKRIGDLLTSAGDSGEARKAYAEALQHYEKALTAFPDPKSRENRKVVKEMADIPKG